MERRRLPRSTDAFVDQALHLFCEFVVAESFKDVDFWQRLWYSTLCALAHSSLSKFATKGCCCLSNRAAAGCLVKLFRTTKTTRAQQLATKQARTGMAARIQYLTYLALLSTNLAISARLTIDPPEAMHSLARLQDEVLGAQSGSHVPRERVHFRQGRSQRIKLCCSADVVSGSKDLKAITMT